MSQPEPPVFKAHTPPALVAGLTAGAIALVAGLIFSVWWLQQQNVDARMRGTVVEKQFVPNVEDQVTLGRDGLQVRNVEGEFLIYVDVPARNGEPTRYRVDLRTRERFDSVAVGDSFDVGPYLVPTVR